MLSRSEQIKKDYEKWPTCPITQEKIIIPAQVFYKDHPESDIMSVRLYEHAAIIGHHQTCVLAGKRTLEPMSLSPIARITQDAAKFSELKKLKDDAREINIMDEKTYGDLNDKFNVAAIHFQATQGYVRDLLVSLNQLRVANQQRVIDMQHHVHGKPLLHELIRLTSEDKPAADSLPGSIIDQLIEHFRDSISYSVKNSTGVTPLMQAAADSHFLAFNTFLPKNSINEKDDFGNTALHHLIQAKITVQTPLLFRAAIDAGADMLIPNKKKQTPLGNLIFRSFACSIRQTGYLTECLKYALEKYPDLIFKHMEIAIAESCDDNMDLFLLCIEKCEVELALTLAEAGHPSVCSWMNENSRLSVLHALASNTQAQAIQEDSFHYSRIVSALERLILLGCPITNDAQGKSFLNVLASPTPNLPVRTLQVSIQPFDQMAQGNWLFFANKLLCRSSFSIDVAQKLLQTIIRSSETSYAYKRCLQIILKGLHGDNQPNVYMAAIDGSKIITPEKFAVDCNNAIALEIMLKENLLSMSKTHLYHYAKFTRANRTVLGLLAPDQSKALTRPRCDSDAPRLLVVPSNKR